MAQKFANAARGVLASTIAPGTTTIEITEGGDLFPVANGIDWFKAVLQDEDGIEIVRVNARTGNVFTVIRGQEGTTARAFSAGTVVGLRITAADVEDSIAAAANSVQLSGNQTIAGTKTFSNQIVASGGVQGNVTGNAGTVTNGVYTTGDQTIGGLKQFTDRVGIGGPAAPGVSLHVRGTSTRIQGFTCSLGFLSPNAVNNWYVGANVSDTVNDGLHIGQGTGIGGTLRMRIDSSGNVTLPTIGQQFRPYFISGTNHAYIAAEPGGGIVFGTGVAGVFERMRIESGGNVLVTNPAASATAQAQAGR